MKNLFKNFWITLALMLVVAIGDLVFLTKYDFGIGFVLAGIYFAWGTIRWFNDKKDKI
jgi:hypothetical protein